jgi:uncharacterized iron-regulated membrane protein
MTRVVIAAVVALAALAIIAAGITWVYRAGQAAIKAETLGKAVVLVQQRDKLNTNVRNATAEDICARLGGKTVNGECI